jgi:hypothetical protein
MALFVLVEASGGMGTDFFGFGAFYLFVNVQVGSVNSGNSVMAVGFQVHEESPALTYVIILFSARVLELL